MLVTTVCNIPLIHAVTCDACDVFRVISHNDFMTSRTQVSKNTQRCKLCRRLHTISRTWSVRIECLFGLLRGICPLLPKQVPIATNCYLRTLLTQRPATISMLLSLPAIGEVQAVGHDAIDGRVQGRVGSGWARGGCKAHSVMYVRMRVQFSVGQRC